MIYTNSQIKQSRGPGAGCDSFTRQGARGPHPVQRSGASWAPESGSMTRVQGDRHQSPIRPAVPWAGAGGASSWARGAEGQAAGGRRTELLRGLGLPVSIFPSCSPCCSETRRSGGWWSSYDTARCFVCAAPGLTAQGRWETRGQRRGRSPGLQSEKGECRSLPSAAGTRASGQRSAAACSSGFPP